MCFSGELFSREDDLSGGLTTGGTVDALGGRLRGGEVQSQCALVAQHVGTFGHGEDLLGGQRRRRQLTDRADAAGELIQWNRS